MSKWRIHTSGNNSDIGRFKNSKKNKKIEEIIDNNKNAELVRISSENYDDEVLDKTFTMGSLFAKEKNDYFF